MMKSTPMIPIQTIEQSMEKEKNQMIRLLNDVVLRLKKYRNAPAGDQIKDLLQQIENDREALKNLAKGLGKRILKDYQSFDANLMQCLEIPNEQSALPLVEDDLAILLNQLK